MVLLLRIRSELSQSLNSLQNSCTINKSLNIDFSEGETLLSPQQPSHKMRSMHSTSSYICRCILRMINDQMQVLRRKCMHLIDRAVLAVPIQDTTLASDRLVKFQLAARTTGRLRPHCKFQLGKIRGLQIKPTWQIEFDNRLTQVNLSTRDASPPRHLYTTEASTLFSSHFTFNTWISVHFLVPFFLSFFSGPD